MKLYFWILEDNYRDGPSVRFEECEVIGKEKTYAPVGAWPKGYFGKYIKKEKIGVVGVDYCSPNLVVTMEKDPALPMMLFDQRENMKIERLKMELAKSRKKIKAVEGFLQE